MLLINLLQGADRDTDTEDRPVDSVGEGEGGTSRAVPTCTLSCVKQTDTDELLYRTRSSAWYSLMTYRGGMEIGRKGGSAGTGYMYA